MRKIGKALATILLGLPILNGCGSGVTRPEIPVSLTNVNSITYHDVLYRMEADKYIYSLNEIVDLTYSVSNLTERRLSLGPIMVCENTLMYKFCVEQDSDEVWKNIRIMSSCDTIIDFSLDAYETKRFRAHWNMKNDNGTPAENDDFLVKSGRYRIMGELNLLYWGGVEVPIQIKIN